MILVAADTVQSFRTRVKNNVIKVRVITSDVWRKYILLWCTPRRYCPDSVLSNESPSAHLSLLLTLQGFSKMLFKCLRFHTGHATTSSFCFSSMRDGYKGKAGFWNPPRRIQALGVTCSEAWITQDHQLLAGFPSTQLGLLKSFLCTTLAQGITFFLVGDLSYVCT